MRSLIVEDHSLLTEGYRKILEELLPGPELTVDEVQDCKTAYDVLRKSRNSYDLILLDINLPADHKRNVESGMDLIPLIKSNNKDCLLVVLTSHSQAILLYDLLREHQPNGLLVKTDFNSDSLKLALQKIFGGTQVTTDSVTAAVDIITSKKEYLDLHNRQIITLISKGIKTKSMTKYLPLSTSAIDKRKAQIKDYFLIRTGSDEDIVREARKFGLI